MVIKARAKAAKAPSSNAPLRRPRAPRTGNRRDNQNTPGVTIAPIRAAQAMRRASLEALSARPARAARIRLPGSSTSRKASQKP